MKRLTVLVFICVAFLLVSGCGTPTPPAVPDMGTVTGYVTDGQGGPAVAGAAVTCQTYSTTTDAQGYFSLNIEANKTCDLIVAKAGRASSRVQGLKVRKDETIKFSIQNRSIFNPAWSLVPPVITVSGVDVTAALSGQVTFHIDATDSERMVNKIYAYFGGEQRSPRDATIFDTPVGDCTVNTALYPNGTTYLRVLVYDDNDNSAMTIIPVTVNNTASETAPGDMAVLRAIATSFGVNVGYYSTRRVEMFKKYGLKGNPYLIDLPEGGKFDLRSAPAGTTTVVALSWNAVASATSYRVYRSFDGTSFDQIGVVTGLSYNDYSPYVSAEKQTWYKVAPCNNAGLEGAAITRTITPLAPFNVTLGDPVDKSTNVPLVPTFTWHGEAAGTLPADASMRAVLTVYDTASYVVFQQAYSYTAGDDVDGVSVDYSSTLEPGHVYSWDISDCRAMVLYYNQADGYSVAYSYAGEINGSTGGSLGSINGENMFTTVSQ